MENSACNVSETELTTVTSEDAADIAIKDPFTNASAPNMYVVKRNFIHQLMDVALMMANVSQLKALLAMETTDKYFYVLLCFISLSILLQVHVLDLVFQIVFTICMLIIWSIEKKLEHSDDAELAVSQKTDKKEQIYWIRKKKTLADRLDKFGNILVLLIIVANVFITAFGVEPHTEGKQSTVIEQNIYKIVTVEPS